MWVWLITFQFFSGFVSIFNSVVVVEKQPIVFLKQPIVSSLTAL